MIFVVFMHIRHKMFVFMNYNFFVDPMDVCLCNYISYFYDMIIDCDYDRA